MRKKALHVIGERVDRLLLLEEIHIVTKTGRKMLGWRCLCDCGNEHKAATWNLFGTRKTTRSCGCKNRELGKNATHGMTRTRTYKTWRSMRYRCDNEKCAGYYSSYGGKGIRVCARWQEFENFLADMGERPANTTIDRIDPNGNYEPDNCRWATIKEQANNKRKTVFYRFDGSLKTASQIATASGVVYQTLKARLRRGWTIEQATSKFRGRACLRGM